MLYLLSHLTVPALFVVAVVLALLFSVWVAFLVDQCRNQRQGLVNMNKIAAAIERLATVAECSQEEEGCDSSAAAERYIKKTTDEVFERLVRLGIENGSIDLPMPDEQVAALQAIAKARALDEAGPAIGMYPVGQGRAVGEEDEEGDDPQDVA